MNEVTGAGELQPLRAVREEENEACIGGLRNAARSVVKVPGWSFIGCRMALIIKEVANANQAIQCEVLDHLGNKDTSRAVPESLCCELREKLCSMLGFGHEVLAPGPGGLFSGLFEGLTLATQDPDVHVHEWLRGAVPLGITASIPPGSVFPTVSPQCVGREADRLRYLNAKVWVAENKSSYHEHKEKAGKVLQTEMDKGMCNGHRVGTCLSEKWGPCIFAKMAVVVKGEKSVSYLRHEAQRHEFQSHIVREVGFAQVERCRARGHGAARGQDQRGGLGFSHIGL